MGKYLVISETWIHAEGTACAMQQPAGAVIEWDGNPGVTLFPLDDDARSARQRVIMTRNWTQRETDELSVRRFRAALGRPDQKKLDDAMAEFAQWQIEQEEAARRHRIGQGA